MDTIVGTACLGVMFGTLVLLCLLDQEDGNRQFISTRIKQNFDVEFPSVFFSPSAPHVLVDFVVFTPGHGRSVTDF